jgi:hypothetical protein
MKSLFPKGNRVVYQSRPNQPGRGMRLVERIKNQILGKFTKILRETKPFGNQCHPKVQSINGPRQNTT